MGTDSHALVEVQINGQWRPMVEPVWPVDADTDAHTGRPRLDTTPGLPRHYGLFSLLADVRNRTGRMGSVMQHAVINGHEVDFEYDMDDGGHDPLIPISVPRGLPDDAFIGFKSFASQRGIHDPTWLLASEIRLGSECYDQPFIEHCIATEEEYLEFVRSGKEPKLQARSMGGPGTRVVSELEYAEGVRGDKDTGVSMSWASGTLREDLPLSWWAICAMMVMVAPDGDLEKVRLLLAFDS